MSTPCTTCGEPLDPADERCPTCAALASPVEDARPVAGDPTRADAAPPWSIPIREPMASPRPTPTSGIGRLAGMAVVGVVVLALAALLASRLLDDGEDTAGTAGETAQADPVASDESGGMDPDAISTSTTAAPSSTTTTTAPTTTTTVVATTVAPTTTAAPRTTTTTGGARTAPNGTGSVPALSTSFRGWLAQLTSVPYDAGTDGLADEWKRLRGAVPGAVAARSDDWAAFRDGFWVLVDPGPFSSPEEVRAFCASAGFDGDGACLPRELRG